MNLNASIPQPVGCAGELNSKHPHPKTLRPLEHKEQRAARPSCKTVENIYIYIDTYIYIYIYVWIYKYIFTDIQI